MKKKVTILQIKDATYPNRSPFHPTRAYPEYVFASLTRENNSLYEAVRSSLYLAGLDQMHYGSSNWNPLGHFIKPGQTVLLKPNMVKESHPRDPHGWQYTISHGSIIRAVADYVWKALHGRGRIIVADAPQTDSSFSKIADILGLNEIASFYRKKDLDFQLIDLRKEEWRIEHEVIVERKPLGGDPAGNVSFDLAEHSEFFAHPGEGRYYGADYDKNEVNQHHSHGKHEYLLSRSAIECDVLINIPKLKTHKKTGITVNLKNLVGINGNKNWLPHHTNGYPENGGDQYPNFTLKRSIEHSIVNALRNLSLNHPRGGTWLLKHARKTGKLSFGDTEKVIRSGNWYGNDTTWRMCLDLNKLLLYGKTNGKLRTNGPKQRKTYLSFVDGVIAGQGAGPMNPDPFPSGILLFGVNPAEVDAVCAVLMGYDPEKISIIRNAFKTRSYSLSEGSWQEIQCKSNNHNWIGNLCDIYTCGDVFQFAPHFGWKGHIERD